MKNLESFKSLAVLIDGENISPKSASKFLEELNFAKFAVVRRVYADFGSPNSAAWSDALKKYALSPYHVPRLNSGKNACDIQLAIDAMDLLHSAHHDGFCIVSSDSDFSAVAIRIRQQGLKVFGFGEEKTPTSFRDACSSFQLLDDQKNRAKKSTPTEMTLGSDDKNRELEAKLLEAVTKLKLPGDWLSQSEVGNKLAKSGIKAKDHGFGNLSKMFSATQVFDTRLEENGSRSVKLKNKLSKFAA